MTPRWTITRKLLAAAITLTVSACGGNSSNSTTTPSPTIVATPTPVLFEGTLVPGGFAFYSFTVSATGDAYVMLASVTGNPSPGSESTVVLGLGLGTPLATDCTVTQSVLAQAGLQSPIVGSQLAPGIYCVRVSDIGNLKSTVNFAIRIVHT